jgi:tetratricopeptide (TPR) repeat protein
MQKQVATYPLDARGHLQLSYIYRAAGDGASALKEIKAAITLSPQKEGFWIEAGAAEWDIGDVAAAQKSFHTAYELGRQFSDLAVYAAAGDIAAGESAAAQKLLLDTFGTTAVDSNILAVAYYRAKDWPRLIGFWKARTEKPGASAETWFSLAAVYYTLGDKANAIAIINKAVALYPAAAAAGADAIAQIQGRSAGQ